MAEELNIHFSSVFTREDISSLPVPETTFTMGPEGKVRVYIYSKLSPQKRQLENKQYER